MSRHIHWLNGPAAATADRTELERMFGIMEEYADLFDACRINERSALQ
jgi:hypothetical protein